MSIPKKGSREIVVGNERFLWRVRSRPTYVQALAQSPLRLAIESAERRGSVLVVELPHAHPSNWLGVRSVGVTPNVVARYVRKAIKAGWCPGKPGRQFQIDGKGILQS